ncbi:hypothetical protein Tco_1358150, partial [Tanacetum coccineum]
MLVMASRATATSSEENAIGQEKTVDLDAYDSDCDDISSAKAVLMENLSSYDSDVLSEKAQRIKPTLYDGIVISKKHDVLTMIDDEETLILEEESRTKMLEKQNDPISKEKKINISPTDYSKLNKLSEDFGKRFVPQKELSAKLAFWLTISNPISEESVNSHTPIKIEVPSELLKKELLLENDRLLEQIISQDIVHIAVNSSVVNCNSKKIDNCFVETCNKCLELEAELVKKNDMIEYN